MSSGNAISAEAVITETGAAYLELFELIAAEATDVVAAVGDFFDGAAETLEQSGYIDVCPIGTVAREVANTDERLRVAADRVFSSWTDALVRHLEAAGMAPGAAATLATTIVSGLEGSFILARTRRDADLLRHTGRHLSQLIASQLREAAGRAPRA